jgi:hypothetical protein
MTSIFVARSGRAGLGVFLSGHRVGKGTVLEHSPVIPLTQDCSDLDDHVLKHGIDGEAVGLGCLMLYNHDDDPNAEMVESDGGLWREVIALRTITPGEEITVKYKCPVWFVVR